MENTDKQADRNESTKKPVINFFWSGDDWTFLHNLTIKSHLKCEHTPVIWLHGDTPKSNYWDEDGVVVCDADAIMDITGFMKRGGNFKTASSLWRFNFLYSHGGWYADTDAVATLTWPDYEEWVLCKNYKGMISTGVLKVPPRWRPFLDMIDNMKLDWGNVKLFNEMYKKYYGHNNETVDGKRFFPFKWTEWEILMSDDISFVDVIDPYSIHLYHTMFERAGHIDVIDKWCFMNPESVLGSLVRWVNE